MPCKTGKISYSNLDSANIDISRIQAQTGNKIVPVRAYLCEYCGKWHTTSHKERNNEGSLLKRNAELAKELKALKIEFENYQKAESKEIRKAFKLQCKANEIVINLQAQLEANKKIIKNLRDANYTLIARLNKQQPI